MARKAKPGRWKNIEWLVGGEGDITVGRIGPIRCAATAANAHESLAMLVRRPEESFEDLLMRLDVAIGLALEEGEYVDEING